MATLYADVVARFTNDLLVKLTNPDAAVPTTVNTTNLQQACDDVEFGEFEPHINETYDSTVRKHVILAVLLVKLKLQEYGGSSDEPSAKLRERVEKLAKAIREVRARDRISPQSSSPYTPTTIDHTNPVRPPFDDTYFERFTPEAPGQLPDIDLP